MLATAVAGGDDKPGRVRADGHGGVSLQCRSCPLHARPDSAACQDGSGGDDMVGQSRRCLVRRLERSPVPVPVLIYSRPIIEIGQPA